jgi:thioredoxin 1
MVRQVKNKDEFDTILNNNKHVIVDFYATWCGPCKRIAPDIEKMAIEYKDVIFVKVDVEECDDVSSEYGVKAMPTFLFFTNGKKVYTVVGADLNKIKEKVSSL